MEVHGTLCSLQFFGREENARNLVETVSHSNVDGAAEYSVVGERGRIDDDCMAARGQDREHREARGYNTCPICERRIVGICFVGTGIVCVEGGDEAGRQSVGLHVVHT